MSTKKEARSEDQGRTDPQEGHSTESFQALDKLIHSLSRFSKEEQRQFLVRAVAQAQELADVWKLCQDEPGLVLGILQNHPAAFREAAECAEELTQEQDAQARALLADALGAEWSFDHLER
jgi:hypothetical protein